MAKRRSPSSRNREEKAQCSLDDPPSACLPCRHCRTLPYPSSLRSVSPTGIRTTSQGKALLPLRDASPHVKLVDLNHRSRPRPPAANPGTVNRIETFPRRHSQQRRSNRDHRLPPKAWPGCACALGQHERSVAHPRPVSAPAAPRRCECRRSGRIPVSRS